MTQYVDQEFRSRVHGNEKNRPGDVRDPYRRDKARIIHSAAFRRLQGKTQVMGVGEGDFHRTRLTHSLEVAQIGEGILNKLHDKYSSDSKLVAWLPDVSLIEAACYAHDLGHPPFGHGGEKALHKLMWQCGGFEGNGQTLRILTKLEKYKKGEGLNPTRRLVLAILKYGLPYSAYPEETRRSKPPKCYFQEEQAVVSDAFSPFKPDDRDKFLAMTPKDGKPDPHNMTLDASIMEMADDIAYAVHDLEDIVARRMINREQLTDAIDKLFENDTIKAPQDEIKNKELIDSLYASWSGDRKAMISKLVNFFIANVEIEKNDAYEAPLLAYTVRHHDEIGRFLSGLKGITYDLVVQEAQVQQLEHRGKRIVSALFEEFVSAPEQLIPSGAWQDLDATDPIQRRVCDYVAGMTDAYAQKIYQRLFTPGFGSSHDEL